MSLTTDSIATRSTVALAVTFYLLPDTRTKLELRKLLMIIEVRVCVHVYIHDSMYRTLQLFCG